VFVFLGVGMALPWLVLSFSPQLLKVLPKPGQWMETAKHLLAFPIYATAVWLLWVLVLQVSQAMLAVVLTGGFLVAFGAWIWGAQQASGTKGPWIIAARSSTAAMALAVVGLLTFFDLTPAARNGSTMALESGALNYQPFSKAGLEELRAEGRPVFVNVTAAWCISCLFNERMTLSSTHVASRMKKAGVVALKADWTNQDEEITAFLEGFGRSGVPLYVFFPAGSDAEPIVLPQMLDQDSILKHLEPAASAL
jgi:thiol:disulfide interchange protein DsbD